MNLSLLSLLRRAGAAPTERIERLSFGGVLIKNRTLTVNVELFRAATPPRTRLAPRATPAGHRR